VIPESLAQIVEGGRDRTSITNPFEDDEGEEERSEVFWREVNQSGEERWQAIVKFFREGLISS